MTDLPVLKIFLSSPGVVAEERALAEFVFRRLANEVADAVRLTFVIWEHEPLFGHTGLSQQIERPSRSDLVVSILWSRLGSRLPSDFAPAPRRIGDIHIQPIMVRRLHQELRIIVLRTLGVPWIAIVAGEQFGAPRAARLPSEADERTELGIPPIIGLQLC